MCVGRWSAAASHSAAQLAADAEDLDGVADVGEAVLACDFGGPRLDLAALHLDGGAAHPAHQMVMVMLASNAGTPTRRCRCARCRPDPAAAIDCRVRYTVVRPMPSPRRAQLVVQLLGGAELVERCPAVPRSPRAAWWRVRPARTGHSRSSAAWVTAATTMWARW